MLLRLLLVSSDTLDAFIKVVLVTLTLGRSCAFCGAR
jgi:hypothetical protein